MARMGDQDEALVVALQLRRQFRAQGAEYGGAAHPVDGVGGEQGIAQCAAPRKDPWPGEFGVEEPRSVEWVAADERAAGRAWRVEWHGDPIARGSAGAEECGECACFVHGEDVMCGVHGGRGIVGGSDGGEGRRGKEKAVEAGSDR